MRPFNGYRAMDVLIVERDPMVAEVLADALADVGITADITADEDQAIAGCHDSDDARGDNWDQPPRRGYQGHAVRPRNASPMPVPLRGLPGRAVAGDAESPRARRPGEIFVEARSCGQTRQHCS